MLQRLKNLLNLFKQSNRLLSNIYLPTDISSKEKIARSIFSLINVTTKGELRNNAFRSPPEIDEVSVNRLDYTNASFLKQLSKKIEDSKIDRSYFGFAILNASEIRDNKANVVYSPKTEPLINPFHSDIKVGFVKKRGEELPAEISYRLKKLTEISRFYIDPNINSDDWLGNELV